MGGERGKVDRSYVLGKFYFFRCIRETFILEGCLEEEESEDLG